jgi:hypothetical protein
MKTNRNNVYVYIYDNRTKARETRYLKRTIKKEVTDSIKLRKNATLLNNELKKYKNKCDCLNDDLNRFDGEWKDLIKEYNNIYDNYYLPYKMNNQIDE